MQDYAGCVKLVWDCRPALHPGSLIRAGLVDEFLMYLAPKLLGPGQGIAAFGPLQSLSEAIELQFHSIDRVGADLRIVARVTGRDQF